MRMDDTAESISVIGDRVLLRFEEVKKKEAKSKSGIILPGQDAFQSGQTYSGSMGAVFRAYIESVGEGVNLEEQNFKIGDWVVFNNMDVMSIDLPDPSDPMKTRKFGITKPESIWAVYKEKE